MESERDRQARETPPQAPTRTRGNRVYILRNDCFSVFSPPQRLRNYLRAHGYEREATVANFDYYSPDNCPDVDDSDNDCDIPDTDVMDDYEAAKLGFF